MALFNRNNLDFETILRKYFEFRNESKSIEPLSEFFQSIKEEKIDTVIDFLKNNEEISQNFSYYIFHLFHKKPFNLSLTEANILSENAFFPELRKRILNTILPPIGDENTIWYLIDYISVQPAKDLRFLQNISEDKLSELMKILGVSEFIKSPSVKRELIFSMNILAWRVIGNAMDVEVLQMVPEFKNFDNPFIALQNELDILIDSFKKNSQLEFASKDENYKQLKVYLAQCMNFVETAFKNSSKYGISGKTNQSLLKIRQQIQRMSEILELLVFNNEEDYHLNSKKLVFNILNYKSHKK